MEQLKNRLDHMTPNRRTYWSILKAVLSLLCLALAYQFWRYLNKIEVDILCYADAESDYHVEADTPDSIEVNKNFSTLFRFYGYVLLVDALREFLGIFYYSFQLPIFGIFV